MFRGTLLAIGVLVLLAAAWVYRDGGDRAVAGWLALQGSLLTLAMVWEPWRYRRRIVDAPPPGFTRTEERFEDPGTGRTVTVYVKAATGERAYVAERASP